MKWCEYHLSVGNKVISHGVIHKSRLEYLIQDGALTAELISDEAEAKLEAKWGGSTEPVLVKSGKAA
jgi:hypothetical protein